MSLEPTTSGRRLLGTISRPSMRSRTVHQVVVFTASNGLVSLIGAVSKALLARALPVASFGAFAFATSFLQFSSLVFEFGFFVPASRLAARAERLERRRVVGAALLLYVPVGLAYCLTVFALSFVTDAVFAVHAGDALRVVAPLALVYPFSLIALQLATGTDQLHVYSITAVLTQVLFVGTLGVIVAVDWNLSTGSALALRSAAMLVGSVVLVAWLRPIFRGSRRIVPTLVAQARQWGFKVYVGRVLSLGTYNLDVIILGALTDAKSVGFYTLAGAMAYALGLPITGLASALFPRMAQGGRLKTEWLAIAWAVGGVAVLAAWLLGPIFMRVVFSADYQDASTYVVPLTLAQTIRGVTSIYNAYFSSQAAGRELRDAGVVLTVSNLVLNFALIPPFGGTGAAWASVLALLANLWAHMVGYRRLRPAG
jgi:O-antigen/teichoic acid export membrane protein